MKPTLIILLAIFALSATGSPSTEQFALAQEAYNDGRYAEAAAVYENMLTDGLTNMEIHYNLANTYFKSGDLVKAVWHYRKAWYSDPRDPDIRANLRFALNATGAVPPDPTLTQRVFSSLSLHEWKIVTLSGYLAVCLFLLLAILLRRSRRSLLGLCLLPVAAVLLAGGGWRFWHQLETHFEGVITQADTVARHSPFEEGVAFYKLPAGALVRQEAEQENWIKITYDNKSGGWISKDNILRLSP